MADAKGSSKQADPDDIMKPAEMKQILAVAKRGAPISCVIALSKDKEGILLLDRKIKPKKLATQLKKQSAEAEIELDLSTLRFGHASVDTATDSALVTLTINKEAPNAMRPPLLARLKKAGFTKLVMTSSPAIEEEPEEEEEEKKEKEPPPPATPDDIMAPAQMKQILAIAKRGNPIGCAIALTADKEGVLLLDRKLKPKKVAVLMRKQAAELKLELDNTTVRFGRVVVDTEEDAGLVTIKVNKQASNALRPPLLARLKKAGYTGLELVLDGALEDEEDDDEEAGHPEVPHEIVTALAALLKQFPALFAQVPAQKAALTALATEANLKIKAGDARGAAGAVKLLQTAVATAAGAKANGAAGGAKDWDKKRPLFGNAAKIWAETVAVTHEDLHRIRKNIADAFDGDEEGLKLEKDFLEELNGCLETLDMQLHDELAGISKGGAASGGEDPTAVARKLIDGHIKYLASDPFMKTVDENPFEIKIVKRLTVSLSKIRAVLQ